MKAGRLRHEVTIQAATTTINDAGTPVTTWDDKATVRAERVELSTTEYIRSWGASDETLAIFRTRLIEGVMSADRLLSGGQTFNIRNIAIIDRDRSLEFRCVAISGVT